MTGIIAASEDELKPVLDRMEITDVHEKAKLTFYIGTYKHTEIAAVYSGVCKVNAAIAAQIMIDLYNPQVIYVTGVAGALDDGLKPADTVIISQAAHHDVDAGILTEYHPFMKSVWYDLSTYHEHKKVPAAVKPARIITGEAFINAEQKSRLIRDFSAQVVDMESAAFAQVCYANNVPLVIFKTITDNSDEHGHDSFEENVARCSEICARYVLQYIKES